jgi:hypothetical protein
MAFYVQAIQKIERSEPFIGQIIKFREDLKTVNDFDSVMLPISQAIFLLVNSSLLTPA